MPPTTSDVEATLAWEREKLAAEHVFRQKQIDIQEFQNKLRQQEIAAQADQHKFTQDEAKKIAGQTHLSSPYSPPQSQLPVMLLWLC